MTDQEIALAAVLKGWVTQDEVQECLDRVKASEAGGKKLALADALLQKGYVTQAQIDEFRKTPKTSTAELPIQENLEDVKPVVLDLEPKPGSKLPSPATTRKPAGAGSSTTRKVVEANPQPYVGAPRRSAASNIKSKKWMLFAGAGVLAAGAVVVLIVAFMNKATQRSSNDPTIAPIPFAGNNQAGPSGAQTDNSVQEAELEFARVDRSTQALLVAGRYYEARQGLQEAMAKATNPRLKSALGDRLAALEREGRATRTAVAPAPSPGPAPSPAPKVEEPKPAVDLSKKLGEARSSLNMKDIDQAKSILIEAVNRSPDHSEALGLLARCLIEEGKPQEAAQVAQKALAVNSDQSDALYALGASMESDMPQRAVEFFTRAIQAQPDLAAAFLRRARCQAIVGRVNEALKDVAESARLDVSPENRRECLRVKIKAFAAVAQWDKAIAACGEWIMLDPNNKTPLGLRADYFARSLKTAEAIKDLQAVLRLEPGDLDAKLKLAQLAKFGAGAGIAPSASPASAAPAPAAEGQEVDVRGEIIPRFIVLNSTQGPVRGMFVEAGAHEVTVRTPQGLVKTNWQQLDPFSAWRLRTMMAGSDAGKHVALGAFCERNALWREARWEYATARAIDPSVAIPDLAKLLAQHVEAFSGGGGSGSLADAIKKKLAAQEADRRKARQEKEKARSEERLKLRITEVKTLVNRGPVFKRIDIVFMGDGFTQAEQRKYNAVCDELVKGLLVVEPFSNYPSYINFHRINIVEPTSGLRDGDTACGCEVKNEIVRCNAGKVTQLSKHAPDADLVVVIANVQKVRATATKILGYSPGTPRMLTLDVGGNMDSVALHELGHAFADLDDEYVNAQDIPQHPDWGMESEWRHLNTTRVSNPKKVKWHYWNYPPVPGLKPVGCFEGAYYRDKGYYRPAQDCRMNTTKLASKQNFCPVCLEQMELAFYRLVSPIDEATPLSNEVKAFLDDDLKFEAQAVVTEGKGADLGTLVAKWYIDAQSSKAFTAKGRATSLSTRTANLKAGSHEVVVRVDFVNRRVRRDRGYLSGQRIWDLEMLPLNRPRGKWTGDPKTKISVAFGDAPSKLSESGMQGGIFEAPIGSIVDPSELSVQVRRDPALSGLFVVRAGVFSKTDGRLLHVEEKTAYLKPEKNTKPYLRLPEEIEAEEGSNMYFRIEAMDGEGDALFYGIEGMPPGASVDSATGEIFWEINWGQAGVYPIKVTVDDGAITASATTRINVKSRPLADPSRLSMSDLSVLLRSEYETVVRQVMPLLSKARPTFQLLEYARLSRHGNPNIAAAAFQALRGLLEGDDEGKLWSMFMFDIEPYLWQFCDNAEALDFFDGRFGALVKDTKANPNVRSQAEKLKKAIAEIRGYNKSRGM